MGPMIRNIRCQFLYVAEGVPAPVPPVHGVPSRDFLSCPAGNKEIDTGRPDSSLVESTAQTAGPYKHVNAVQEGGIPFTGDVQYLRTGFDDYSSVMRPTNSERQADLWAIDQEGKILRRVRVRLLDMQWGGGYIENSCHYVFGIVLDMVLEGICGMLCFQVNFGTYLDVQEVPVHLCEAWSPPATSAEELSAVSKVISTSRATPCLFDDMVHFKDIDRTSILGSADSWASTTTDPLCSEAALDEESDLEWKPPPESCWAGAAGSLPLHSQGYSTGELEPDPMDTPAVLLDELGDYTTAPAEVVYETPVPVARQQLAL